MKRLFLLSIIFIPTLIFAEWNCNIKLIDSETISLSMSDINKFRFSDEDNLTINLNDGAKDVIALSTIDDITFSGTLNVIDVDASSSVIYPNPTDGILNVKGAAGLDYIIINFSSVKVKSGVIPSNDVINLSSLENGAYIIVLRNNSAYKFIKK